MRNEWKPWPLNGYAPGSYHCKCHHCGGLFEGDKRAVTCLECAVVLSKEASSDLRMVIAGKDKALRELAAEWHSPLCSIGTAIGYVSEEFQRRMQIAADALELKS